MSVFYLIRHGNNDWVGKKLAGWLPGVHLNEEGRRQADQAAEILAARPITRIFSSPLDRAKETAAPLARKLGLEVHYSAKLGELHFGDWTGQSIEELSRTPAWRRWNAFRSAGRIPNGEMISEAQARMVSEIERLRCEFPEEQIAIFSHGDPIRAALMHYLGMPLDFLPRLEVSPAGISILSLTELSAEIHCVNDRAASR